MDSLCKYCGAEEETTLTLGWYAALHQDGNRTNHYFTRKLLLLLFFISTNSDAWKISHPHEKIATFQFSSSVHFPPTFEACQSNLTALFFPQHPKSCQNTLHEHDITFQVLTVITEKNKCKKVTVFSLNLGLLIVMRLDYLSFLSRYSCFFLETPASSVVFSPPSLKM